MFFAARRIRDVAHLNAARYHAVMHARARAHAKWLAHKLAVSLANYRAHASASYMFAGHSYHYSASAAVPRVSYQCHHYVYHAVRFASH